MNIFNKLKERIFGKKEPEEEVPECWYNNAHEKGEAMRNSADIGSGGGEGAYEAHATEAAVRK